MAGSEYYSSRQQWLSATTTAGTWCGDYPISTRVARSESVTQSPKKKLAKLGRIRANEPMSEGLLLMAVGFAEAERKGGGYHFV